MQVNQAARVAGWASLINILAWLLMAIPGFLLSPLSILEVVILPASALAALGAGIFGFLRKEQLDPKGAGQCVAGISIGVLNLLLIGLGLAGISAMVNCC